MNLAKGNCGAHTLRISERAGIPQVFIKPTQNGPAKLSVCNARLERNFPFGKHLFIEHLDGGKSAARADSRASQDGQQLRQVGLC
jgi:hypothetical protein